jgi:LysM repeat protein
MGRRYDRLLAALAACAALPSASAHGAAPKPPEARYAAKSDPLSERARPPDVHARRVLAGGPTADDLSRGAETPELRQLREAERVLFPQLNEPSSSDPPLLAPKSEGGRDLSWLRDLALPALPVRWDPRLVRYLELFRGDAKWRSTFSLWLRRTGRWAPEMRRALRSKGLPEDLVWAAAVESSLDPSAQSKAGAAGMWQLMPEVGRLYGLRTDRWVDQRFNALASTQAAVEMFSDLYRRFGSWELALAAYNMGYAGLAAVVRKYNTNDYWVLSRLEGALPWETTLHVPKVVAAAIVGRNLKTFGFADVALDEPPKVAIVHAPPSTPLSAIATAASVPVKEIEALNPELRASRTPPAESGAPAVFGVRVPIEKHAQCTSSLAKLLRREPPLGRYVVRFGETLDEVARRNDTTVARIAELNGITKGEVVRGGTVLVVPQKPLRKAPGRDTAPEPERESGSSPADAVAAGAAKADGMAEPGSAAEEGTGSAQSGASLSTAAAKRIEPVPARDTLQSLSEALAASGRSANGEGSGPRPLGGEGTLGRAAGPALAPKVGAVLVAGDDEKWPVIVPADVFMYPERKRVFYRVLQGDSLRDVAEALKVTVEDLLRWNEVDGSAKLHEGMTLQAFVREDVDLRNVVLLKESDVRILPVGSDEFFAHFEEKKGRKRITVTARANDTLASIGTRYGVSIASMERINRRSRNVALKPGERIVVYVPPAGTPVTPALTASAPASAHRTPTAKAGAPSANKSEGTRRGAGGPGAPSARGTKAP